MKKLILENNGNFSIVSHAYVLYGRKHGERAYVHMEDKLNIMYWYGIQEEEYCNM